MTVKNSFTLRKTTLFSSSKFLQSFSKSSNNILITELNVFRFLELLNLKQDKNTSLEKSSDRTAGIYCILKLKFGKMGRLSFEFNNKKQSRLLYLNEMTRQLCLEGVLPREGRGKK